MILELLTALAATAGAASLQTEAPPACVAEAGCATNLSAVDVFAIAERYAAAGRFADAEELLEGLTRDPNEEVRAEARFRLAFVRERQGDLSGAIEAHKALLDEKPGAQRVRLELARLLAATGDESGARRELRRAGSAGLPDDVARAVDRFATALRSTRPLGGSIEVAIAPDTNINRASAQDEIDTVLGPATPDADAQATSGVGVSLAAQGFWRADVGDDVAILTRLSGRGDFYGKSRFNDIGLSLASGPEFRWGGARLRPAAIYSRRWFGGDAYSRSLGGSFNLLKPLGLTSQIEAEATILDIDYRLAPEQSGTLYDVNAAYDRAFSPRFSGRAGLRFTRHTAREPSLATTSGAIELLASRSFGKQILFVQGSASRLEADERLFLFPEKRRDTRFDLTAGIVVRQLSYAGLAPVIRLTQTFSKSTVDIYDFNRTRVEFGLSREF